MNRFYKVVFTGGQVTATVIAESMLQAVQKADAYAQEKLEKRIELHRNLFPEPEDSQVIFAPLKMEIQSIEIQYIHAVIE